MCRSSLIRAAVAVAATVSLGTNQANAICAGGVTAFGFENCPLGAAVLNTNGFGQVVVSNIGPGGNDGVEMLLDAPPKEIITAFMALSEPAMFNLGAFINFAATGVVDAVPGMDLVSTVITREDVNSSGFLYTVTVQPDFTPIGDATYDVTVTSNGVIVFQDVNLQGRVLIRTPLPPRGLSPPILRLASLSRKPAAPVSRIAGTPELFQGLQWQLPIQVLLPGQVVPVVGNAIVFTGGNAGATIETLSTLELTGANINSITIINEQAIAAAPIPTVSEWGLIMLTILLVIAGIIVIGRGRVPLTA